MLLFRLGGLALFACVALNGQQLQELFQFEVAVMAIREVFLSR